MAKKFTVVISQGQSANPVKRKLEEDLVAALLFEQGVEVTVVPHLYDLAPDGTGMLCLQGIAGDAIVLSWLYPRAAFWTLARNGIRGREGISLLKLAGEDDDEDDVDETAPQAERGDEASGAAADEAATPDGSNGDLPRRKIYCIDLRAAAEVGPFVEEIRRIVAENQVQTVDLLGWIKGSPSPEQMERYLDPAKNGNGHAGPPKPASENAAQTSTESAADRGDSGTASPPGEVVRVAEQPARRWYPVIDFSRCTNCMECIDFCLFGVYGVDAAEQILVEQPDNCRKGCPACSRVCPENAIIFPQHKTPAIAGSADGEAGAPKIDLSKLFGAPDGIKQAALERDVELVAAGRDAVGLTVGIPKRQSGKSAGPKDELDELMDALDELEI